MASTQRVIALGFVHPRVIIIAIRGTASLYDVLYDIDVGQANLHRIHACLILHQGFYSAIYELCAKLSLELLKYIPSHPTVYVTGHSLGGAMAAILHGLWEDLLPQITKKRVQSLCAYTYGMPRYGNEIAIDTLRVPYPIYNPYDPVPYLPPRRWGFWDHFVEFAADTLKDTKRPASKEVPWSRIISLRRNHMIESYRKKIHAIVDPNPTSSQPKS